MQIDFMKPTLKAPGTKRSKLKHDEPLSSSAFKFNLRRYNQVPDMWADKVGRCRLTESKTELKARLV
jgi:hypothetical protein